uniref:DUF6598 domain-containing protein n=1 Tax=Leersia perrieri TaxID=77586 RepID=A0A0D9XXU1_9ORYZ
MEGAGGCGDCDEAHEGTVVASSSSLRPSSSKRKATVDLEEDDDDDDLQEEEEDSYSRLPPPPAKDSSYLYPCQYSEDGVNPAYVIPGSKHRDGSIYRRDKHYWHGLYHLDNTTSETGLEPMTRPYSEKDCKPCNSDCQWHTGDSMMQIFYIKLAEISDFATTAGGDGIQLYGFMAVRDLLDPLRNYVFNRTKGDPFTIHDISRPFIQMSGPKRGIAMDSTMMIEYDMKIKMGQNEQDDRILIDGAATFSELANFEAYTFRIRGDCNMAVDTRLAHLWPAIEARKQVCISELKDGCGRLNLTITCDVSHRYPQIKLFEGPIDKLRDQNRFVVAALQNTLMVTEFKLVHQHGSISKRFEYRVVPHGSMFHCAKFLDLATIGLEIFWSVLPG